jgi:RNase P/RNase MRP subunit p29
MPEIRIVQIVRVRGCNTTLIAVVNDTIQALKLNTESAIIQVPRIAHVFQLSLNDLLGKIKASPKNDNAELEWKEDRVRALQARDCRHTKQG